MDNAQIPNIKVLLIGLSLLLLAGFGFYSWVGSGDPYTRSMSAAHRAFADADYEQALKAFIKARELRPVDYGSAFGQALSLMQLGLDGEALAAFTLALEAVPSSEEKAFLFANRGILHDREQRYPQALADYDLALGLSAKVTEGPGVVKRFMHNQAEKPPTIADRARFLRAELARPEGERQLSIPEQDARVYPYRQ